MKKLTNRAMLWWDKVANVHITLHLQQERPYRFSFQLRKLRLVILERLLLTVRVLI